MTDGRTVTISVHVDDSELRPILAAAKGSRRPYWKYLSAFTFWCSNLALGLFLLDLAADATLTEWHRFASDLVVAGFFWAWIDTTNERDRARAVLRSLSVKVGAS